MTAEVKEHIGEIRGVKVRWVDVIVAGHTVEQVLSFDVAEAEAVHGRPFDGELDEHIQMGMFAVDRISADGTEVERKPWSCVPGTEPMSHSDLPMVVESKEA